MGRRFAVVALSGGMDSTTLLAVALNQGCRVECIGFKYGSKHNEYENRAAVEVATHYGVSFQLLDLSAVMGRFQSNLLKSGGEIPEGHYEAETMSQTVVPGRNIIFASLLTGYAWSRAKENETAEVWLGIHSGDHAIYPDCRPEFYHKMREAISFGTDQRVVLQAPFLMENKTSIIRQGLGLGVPYEITRTCYCDQPVACGKCGSCQERLESFRNNGTEDPIPYETREALPK